MDVILVPGLWLDGSSWEAVVPVLERAGHRAYPLTLPGLESKDADRSAVTLQDQVDAVVAAIDAAEGPVTLIGHSAGGPLAYAAADARPDRVARIVYVGSEPRGTDDGGEGPYPAEGADVPLPDWSFFDDEMVADLDDEARAALRERAIPSPVRAIRDPQRLSGRERLYDIPSTVLCCEYSAANLQQWTADGEPGTEELAKLRDVEYVDLNCGHWPQVTRPEELGRAILASFSGSR